jgi:hypothetical protein
MAKKITLELTEKEIFEICDIIEGARDIDVASGGDGDGDEFSKLRAKQYKRIKKVFNRNGIDIGI